jgi:ABC-type nitrate/sulfonate/bicarbonate transport system ATPase subunit
VNVLALDGVSKTFESARGERVVALAPVSLEIPRGRFLTILGPSGCGKSTIFNIIAGLEMPSTGNVTLDGTPILGMSGVVSYMLQKDLLLPWRSIIDNVILGMEIDRVPRAEAKARALPLLERYGLGGFENRYPAELSGGMRQRAALLRTMLCDRDVILLDEPFAALDAQTRSDMQEWLLDVWDDFKKTVIFVTHDVDEGVYLSDEIVMMSGRPGRILERVPIELARPRKRSIITSRPFVGYKEHFLSLLHRPDVLAAAS